MDSRMSLQRIALALGSLAIALTLAVPARADQTFWTFSTGPVPKPAATANPNVAIDYLYYGCPQLTMSDGRFNPFDTRGNASTKMRQPNGNCSNQNGHHHRPNPQPAPIRRVPLAKPT